MKANEFAPPFDFIDLRKVIVVCAFTMLTTGCMSLPGIRVAVDGPSRYYNDGAYYGNTPYYHNRVYYGNEPYYGNRNYYRNGPF